jgi:hypothetical protein
MTRCRMYASDRVPVAGQRPDPLQLALTRGQRWLAMLETGEVNSLRELARKEGADRVRKIWRTTVASRSLTTSERRSPRAAACPSKAVR